MTLKSNPSLKDDMPETKPSGRTSLVADIRKSAKPLLLISSLLTASCSLGYKEMTRVSEKCGTVETCQDSLDQVVEKGVSESLDNEWKAEYAARLLGGLEVVEKDLLERIKAQEESLLVIEKYKAPNWAEKLGPDEEPSEAGLAILLETTRGILENSEHEEFEFQQKLTPTGMKKLNIMAKHAQR